MKLIAITGGIGSGKSVVARLVGVMGYQVYDCDSRAKALMAEDARVRNQLIDTFGKETYIEDGSINRQYLAAVAFANDESLARLNDIVHPATACDLSYWAEHQAANGATLAFVETALLRTSGLDKMVDEVWHVTAPDNVRVARVISRSELTEQEVQERMAAQANEVCIGSGENVIVNDGNKAILPQVLNLITTM